MDLVCHLLQNQAESSLSSVIFSSFTSLSPLLLTLTLISNNYKKEFKKRMDLEMKINSSLTRDYMLGKDFVNHFYNQDRDIPIWAAFESLTLGEFGTFYSCANKKIREAVSKQLNLPKNFNDDGFLLADIIFALKDLRNAIAHNGIIFDTRFATQKVPDRIKKMLEQELNIKTLDFNYIVSYIALIIFLLNRRFVL